MRVTTKKGDSGYTSLLRGQMVPKYHPATEALGGIDEANSLLGLARAKSGNRRIKRIILHVQKHLFIIGAELSVPKGYGKPPGKTISETDIKWLEKLIEDFEEILALPPGFVAFGQEESSSPLDVSRTSVRRAERTAVKMMSDNMIDNPHIIKYLNRLSDLIFLLACFEEKGGNEKQKISRALIDYQWLNPVFRSWTLFSGLLILILKAIIVLILTFHDPGQKAAPDALIEHLEEMKDVKDMHNIMKQ
jgi:cob(I)alamin adenosyltransferase